jgi:tripartite ATP-independent transporter DctP family solute receptor
MNKRSTLKLAAVAALVAASFGMPSLAQAQTKLKFAHVYETSEAYHKYALWAADEIKKRTNGRYEIQVFPASTLGKESDINQGLTLGTVDVVLTGASFAARSYTPLAISYFPFIFRDAEHQLKYANSDTFRDLASGYDKASGNHVVALTYYGARHVTSNRPIAKPEDMKGLKIRVPDAPAYLAFPKALGANPTPIAFAEVYLALQNGTVEAQENPLPTIEAKKFYEVQKNISLTGHIVDSLLTVVSGATWGKLNDADKKIFADTLREAAERCSREIAATETKLAEDFKKRGINVIAVDKNAWREAVLKTTKPTDHGYRQADYDKIINLK